jgi:hypothetical protein
LNVLLSHFQKLQEHEFLMYGWNVMDQSLSRNFELQTWITFTPQGQMEWGFLLQSCFNMFYHNHSLHFIKSHHINIAFSMWIEFEIWREKLNLKNKHCIHLVSLAFASKTILQVNWTEKRVL